MNKMPELSEEEADRVKEKIQDTGIELESEGQLYNAPKFIDFVLAGAAAQCELLEGWVPPPSVDETAKRLVRYCNPHTDWDIANTEWKDMWIRRADELCQWLQEER